MHAVEREFRAHREWLPRFGMTDTSRAALR
jgi:hypothetical protein